MNGKQTLEELINGIIGRGDWDEREARAREIRGIAAAAVTERYRQSLLRQGIGAREVERILADDYRPTEALAAVKRAVERAGGLYLLLGPPGTGKSCAACWWLSSVQPATTAVRTIGREYVHAQELQAIPAWGDRWQQLQRRSALVIDDLGVEVLDSAGALLAGLDALADARYRHGLPLLLTSNLEPAAFKARYGERISRRIRETGWAHVCVAGVQP